MKQKGQGVEDHSSALKKIIKKVTSPKTRAFLVHRLFQLDCMLKRTRKAAAFMKYPMGINLIGHIRGDFGLGQSCRLLARAIEHSGLDFGINNVPLNGPANEKDLSWQNYEQDDLHYDINIVHLNPAEIEKRVFHKSLNLRSDRYQIGFWLWELPEFPDRWNSVFSLFDEIWTPAEFISEAIRKKTSLPVYTLPYAMEEPLLKDKCNRQFFGLPEKPFLFLLSYDGNSVSTRKNPMASIRAYQQAFSAEIEDVGLIIKATHASEEELTRLKQSLLGYPHVYILTDSYSKEEFNSLIACANVYVSLHRAEGFGLVMAEAMAIGTPVIATNWSSNTEFMNPKVACMVDADVVSLDVDCPPYEKGSHWANPKEDQGAAWMRKLYEDRAFGKVLSENAKTHIKTQLSLSLAAERISSRIREIRQDKGSKEQ